MPNESAKIILAVTNGKLSKVRDSLAVEGTINALKCGFQFRTSDWNNTIKTAVFVRGRVIPSTTNADTTYVMLDENNECDVPAEILAKDGMFSVGVFGIRDDYRIVSNWMCYRIADGCYADGSTPIDPNSTIYEQIISMLNNKSEVGHTHDDRYYTETEANQLFENVNNKIKINAGAIINEQNRAEGTENNLRRDIDEIKNELDAYAKKSDIEELIPDNIATNEYVDKKVSDLVSSAPGALDTLQELSKALGDDPNFATTMATKLGNKVDKVEGKGLSTNDFTNEEKNKLDGIEDGAEVNVQSDWNQNDKDANDYINNRIAYRDSYTKTTKEGFIDNVQPNTLYLVQDFSQEGDNLKQIIASLKYENIGNKTTDVVLELIQGLSQAGLVTDMQISVRKDNFELIDSVNYGFVKGNLHWYVILDPSKLLTENSTKFTKEGIYFETTVTSVAYVKSKVVRYFKLDENYLPHTVVLEPEINNYVNTVKPKSSEIILPVSNWTGDASPYSQVVTITGATSDMRVDLMPTAVQLQQLVSDSTMLTVENNNSVITVYAIGEKPSVDYSMQVIISAIGGGT